MIQTLPNGLTAILVESHAAPVVALQVWVKVGAADEGPGEAGLAHLHEHMLFKGTARRGPGAIAREVEGRGGEINAWTSHDQTVYHLVLGAPFFRDGLDILADAMRASAFDEAELGRETQVVVEEIKRSEDSPQRRLSRELFRAAYAQHPYRLPVIGTPESVLSFTRPQILDFYRRHYTPRHLTVVAVGDFEEATALQAVEELFGDWHAPTAAPVHRTPEPPQQGPRVRVVREAPAPDNGGAGLKETRLALAFHIPELLHPDVPALDLLAVVLGQGESARLPRTLTREQRLFTEVYAYGYTPRDPGLWVAGGTPTPGCELAALDALIASLGRSRTELFGAGELAKAKHLLESEQVYQHETVQGWARKLGFYETMAGSLEAEAAYQARLQSVTLPEVQAVARRYLCADRASLAVLLAQGTAERPEAALSEAGLADMLSQRLPATPAPFNAPLPSPATSSAGRHTVAEAVPGLRASLEPRPALQRFALPGGGTLLVRRSPEVPLVALRAVYLGGVRGETEANNGLTALLSRTLTRGAAGRSANDIATAIDDLAGSLHGASGRNSFGLRAEFLSRHLDAGLSLFTDCLLHPDFPEAEVDRERAQQLQDIHARDDNPSGLAFELFAKTLYTVHPSRLSPGGEAASVAALDAAVLRSALRERYPLAGLTLSVVGDVRPEEVHAKLRVALAAAAQDGRPLLAAAPLHPPAEPRPTSPRHARRTLAKAQSHLVLGYLGTSLRDPARHALELLSTVLSGQGGRLFIELRDKRSLAYSVTSLSIDGLEPGYFAVYIGTSPEKEAAALAGIRDELAKVRDGRLPEDELARAKQNLIGTHAIGLQRRASVAGSLALDHLYGLGAEAYLHYDQEVHAVTAEAVREAAQTYLDPRGEVLAEVGP